MKNSSTGKVDKKIYEKQLTVFELIDLLMDQPPDAVVWHEGCDCLGAADRVEYEEGIHAVIIGRCN